MSLRTLSFASLLATSAAFALTTASIAASAQPSSAQPAPALAPLAAPPPPPSATPVSSGDVITVAGGYTCDLGEHLSIDPDDARTAADLVCHAIAAHHGRPGAYGVRFGKLGSKILLVLTDHESGEDRRIFLQEIEEVPVAADRLALALVQGKSVEQTQDAENVINASATQPEHQRVQVGVLLGVTALESVGLLTSPSAGVEGDVDFKLHRISLLLEGRAGGIGSETNLTGYGSLGAGARYFFTDEDIAPFAGGGVSFAYYQANRDGDQAYSGSGLAAYGDVGLSFFRSSTVGAFVSLRADVPFFVLGQTGYSTDANGFYSQVTTSSRYVVPISLTLGLRIH
jgi:hypothetical protein